MSGLRHHPFTLRQLQYVVAVAEHLHFGRAAAACGVSQPSLSIQVAQLEAALGVQVFERTRREVRLTAAGRELVEHARSVLIGADDVLAAASRHSDPFAGVLRLGVIPTIGPYLLPAVDPAIRSRWPRLTLAWTEERTELLLQGLREGRLDAALLAVTDELAELEVATLGTDAFVLAAARSHRLGGCAERIGVDELYGAEVMLLSDGHCFRDQALALCGAVGAHESGFRATSLSTLVQMVRGGGGATLLPEMAIGVEDSYAGLTIRRFAGEPPQRTVALAWRRSSPWSGALRAVAEVARLAWRG